MILALYETADAAGDSRTKLSKLRSKRYICSILISLVVVAI